ncbi:hypothetical protein [Allosphingosinicella humi]
MTRLRASACVLIGAAALLWGAAAEGQSSLTGRVVGSHVGRGVAMGSGFIGIPRSGFRHFGSRHFRFGRHGFIHRMPTNAIDNRIGHGFRHRKFGHDMHSPWFGRGGFGMGFFGFDGLGFGGLGYGGDAYYGGARDSDFFAPYSEAGTITDNGRVAYDYDRAYPYDHYRGEEGVDAERRAPPRCTIEWGWDSAEDRDVPIRVCRNGS